MTKKKDKKTEKTEAPKIFVKSPHLPILYHNGLKLNMNLNDSKVDLWFIWILNFIAFGYPPTVFAMYTNPTNKGKSRQFCWKVIWFYHQQARVADHWEYHTGHSFKTATINKISSSCKPIHRECTRWMCSRLRGSTLMLFSILPVRVCEQ